MIQHYSGPLPTSKSLDFIFDTNLIVSRYMDVLLCNDFCLVFHIGNYENIESMHSFIEKIHFLFA